MALESVVFVNVMDVEPASQKDLIDVVVAGVDVVRRQPGFESATVLASTDGARVVNIARWRSADDIEATKSDPAVRAYVGNVARLATTSPNVYSVVLDQTR